MNAAALLPLAVAVPIGGAVAAPLLARPWRHLPVIVSVAALCSTTAILLLVAPSVFSGAVPVHFLGGWGPVSGAVLGITMVADPFGLVFALASAAIGALLLLYTLSELGGLGARELGGYACLFQLLLAALVGGALTADLFNLFVWFEVAALASYGLTGFFLERPIALEAAFKILVLTTVAGFAIFVGIGLLYADHGALNVGQLHQALAGRPRVPDLVALGLLVAGFATKAGLVPFHGWLADAHTAAPGPVSALFSGLMVNFGIVAIGRLVFQVYGVGTPAVLVVLTVTGAISALVGAALALAQDDLKRLLAYDTVSQMGVLAIGLGTATASGVAGAAYHLLSHALFKALLFLCAGAIVHATGETRLSRMGGLARRRPLLAAAFGLGVASIAGVPPFTGYVSLGLIHQGLLESGDGAALAAMLVAQVITLAALGRAGWLAFVRRRAAGYEREVRLRPGMMVGFATLAGCCVAFGVLPRLCLDRLMAPAASALIDPRAYLSAALAGPGMLAPLSVPFHYADAGELLLVGAGVLLGAALAWWYLRAREPAPIRALRAAHNGSVQDYTCYAIAGFLVVTSAFVLS
ncbi:complex I subunit 5 family protein [Pseudonocardia acaciae]|uniref:complex I subunit 5 family protein n=1 Tax=Pseudonocardia acaciae TaxID=551276 RepID=UPI000491DE1B|nr:proton-conducting transporter membrane subunit [Pseudonocardia acaciae]